MDIKTDRCNSLGIKSSYTIKEVSTLLQLADEYDAHLFIDGYISTGDIAGWMLCKCWFNQFFYYYGICINQDEVNPKVIEKARFLPNARIQSGICWSDSIKNYVKALIEKQFHPVLFYCGNMEHEKIFNIGMGVLRPGDVIAVPEFPTAFHLSIAQKYLVDEKLKRIIKPWINPSIFVGTLL